MAWMNLSSPCLREYIGMVTQLSFLITMLIHQLQKWRSPSVKDTSIGEIYGKAKQNTAVKWSTSYKAGLFCSVVLLAAHCFTMLYMLLLKLRATRCHSPVLAFSAQILQVVSWGITCIAVMNVPKKKNFKFHNILRSWWLCSFIFSGVCLAFDAHMSISNHAVFGLLDYLDAISLLASMFLLVLSIHGNTGLGFLENNPICDPLLDRKINEEHKKIEKESQESPYGRATYLQKVTFSWLNPLFSIGYRKPLEQDEIPQIDVNECAEYCSKTFEQELQRVKQRHETANPSFYKAILLFSWKKAGINALFAVVNAGASYVGPYLINDFVEFLTLKKDKKSLHSGYLLAFAFLSAKIVETVAQRQWIFGARQIGLRLRAALTSRIYQKGLLLSSQSRQSHTSGEIMNYMSVDVQRISDFIWYVNTIWMLPIQISSAIFVLHTQLGLGAFAALATTLMVMACNIPLTKIQKSYQLDIMNAKDGRMKATSEVLKNMKILKLQAWDNHFLQKIKNLRQKEYLCLRKSLMLQATTTFIFWGAPALISVVTFGACVLMGIQLTAGGVISALATFQMLQGPIFNLPDLLSVIAQSKVSADRIASYLQEDEIQKDAIEHPPNDQSHFIVEIRNGTFSWDSKSGSPTLYGIELEAKKGMKVAICGSVGSGKSSLISCILGEMQKISGTVRLNGTKAYVAQSPWILSGNIRGNILFGNVYDSDKYERTIKACALRKDFELFANGDLTEIGERGINMSGGQKQRIQIARAVYQDADIYLLDDPFSAVDAHTGRQLFEECLLGMLKHKTVLYVTHQVEFFSAADLILVMHDGRIAQAGRFEELLHQNVGFSTMVVAHTEALDSISTIEKSSRAFQDQLPEGKSITDTPRRTNILLAQQNSDHNISSETKEKEIKLVQEEEREKGGIGRQVYWAYLTIIKGGRIVPIILLFQSSFQVLQISSNYWMAWASPPTADAEPKFGMNIILFVYMLLAVASSLCVLGRAMFVAVAGLWTAENLFSKMLHSVFHAPMSFFDSTPTGRILNRVSTDQSVVDLEIAIVLGWCAFSMIQIIGTIAVMSQVAWQVFVICIPVAAVCIWYQKYYTPTARELARLAGIQRAPILHHFAESIAGSTTIRAFDQQERFITSNLDLIDNQNRPWFHNVSAMEWLSFRINLLSHFVFAFTLVLLVSLPEGTINPSIAGLGVTYGLNLNVLQATIIWNICNAENKMISVERILQYSTLKSEAPLVVENQRPPDNWPDVGTIIFRNLQVRYAEHFPPVLKNLSCTFPGGKKVGVVGRTGSGKSTLTQAIFRIIEPNLGSILIDDLDICSIGLLDLRSRLSIIPQDPVLFDGTVRGNIDPLSQYTDAEVWEALDKCQLGELLRGKAEKLDTIVVENGENWSAGQRQLFCLGRVLLKKCKILILDEATASVDAATDGVIQRVIGREFVDRTVVTIAHRIHTVIDSDLVLVLSDGMIAEFDTPKRLLERDDSFFSKLIKEYSSTTQSSGGSDDLYHADDKRIVHI